MPRARIHSDRFCACGAKLGPRNVTGVCRACALRAKLVRPVPDGFAGLAAHMSSAELSVLYVAGSATIARWRRQVGIPSPRENIAWLPAPEGFAALAPTKTRNALTKHYCRSAETIDRWCRETGVRPKQGYPWGHAPKSGSDRAFNPVERPHRDESPAGRAAHFLQSKGPIYRCTPLGGAEPTGTHWNRGGYVLTDAEVIARAARLGFEAGASG